MMLGGYYRPDTRPVLERIQFLPPTFLDSPELIVGRSFIGTKKTDGSDNHAHTPERSDRPIIYLDCSFNAGGAAEALKLSRHWRVAFLNCYFVSGAEEPVDICRGGDLYFFRCDFESAEPSGRDVTLKGGARRVTFHSCYNLRQITLGQYSKYDARAVYPDVTCNVAGFGTFARPPVRETQFIDCGPMKVVCLHAERPIADQDCRVTSIPSFAVKAYFWARAKYFKEKLLVPLEEFVIDPREVAP